MTIQKELNQTIKAHLESIEIIRQKLNDLIMNLPDNPKIHRLSDKVNCFVLRFKDLGNNWSPFFHDFKLQYKMLVEIIDSTDAIHVNQKLEDIIEKESYFKDDHTYKFNPAVIEHLTSIYGGSGYVGKRIMPACVEMS